MKNQINVAILVRVSTQAQETSRQISELVAHAEAERWNVVEICEESISGASDESKREGLKRAMQLATEGKVHKILVHEVSRLARKNSIAHKFVEELEEIGVSLYWHQQRIETLLTSGKRNPAASIMFALLAEMARNERETLTERIKSGLEEARRKGKKLGRPEGTKMQEGDFLAKHKEVVRLIRQGQSVRNTAKISGKSTFTVQKVKRILKAA